MSYIRLMILAPVFVEINPELVVESFLHRGQEDEVLELDYSKASKLDPLASLPPDVDRSYLTFPFLTDRKTFAYLNHPDTNVMFIMRGLSGSGKSCIVSVIRSSFNQVVVCSADDFFYQKDGSYKFEQEFLTSAHGTCQQKAKQACKNRVSVIVIDNTNVRRWELKFYADLAKTNGYVVVLVQPKTPWKWNAKELATRNKHGVLEEVLHQKIAKFDNVIPTYYGWFLNERRSKCLVRLSSQIMLECLSKFPKLKQDFLRELKVKFENTDDETVQGILSEYYSSASSTSTLLHCTAKFCAWGKAPLSKDYHERPDVQQACGQMFVLAIAGLVITKRTLGARVSLDSSASVLFARPEEKEWDSQNLKTKKNYTTRQKNVRDKNEKVFQNADGKKNGRYSEENSSISELENTDDCCGFSEASSSPVQASEKKKETVVSLSTMFPVLKFSNETRSAHFTLKTARGVESKDVNFDILRACDLESSRVYTTSDFVPVSRGLACYYGDGLCCVYFDKPISVRTLFSGYY